MKKFTKGEQNLAKRWKIDLDHAFDTNRWVPVQNTVSGAEVKLNSVEADIYSQVMALYQDYLDGDDSVVREYDRLKYLLLKINPTAYMALID